MDLEKIAVYLKAAAAEEMFEALDMLATAYELAEEAMEKEASEIVGTALEHAVAILSQRR